MNKVIFPLKPRMQGPEVADLQNALKLMLEREAIYPGNPRARTALMTKLPSERQTQTYGSATNKIVAVFQEERQLRPDGIVGQQTADVINTLLKEWGVLSETTEAEAIKYQVQGQVQQADVTPLTGALVRAFDKDLRHEQLLGETHTDRWGRYSISYTTRFLRTKGDSINLVVRVFDQQERLLATAETIFNAQALEKVDIKIDKGHKRLLSKYEMVTQALQPLLAGRPISELREDEEDDPERDKVQDLSYLSGETGIAANQLALLVTAEKLGQTTQVAPDIFYGLFRKGMPTDIYELGKQSKGKIRETLEQALEEQLVPAQIFATLDQEIEKLFALPEIQLLRKPLFLAKPEVLFTPLATQNVLDEKERHLIDAKLNHQFNEILINNLGFLTETMRVALQPVIERLGYQSNKDANPIALLRETVLPVLKGNQRLSNEISDIEKRLSDKDAKQTIAKLLHLDKPLQDNPLFSSEIRRAKTLTYAGIAKLSEAATSHLADTEVAIDDIMLANMVGNELAHAEEASEMSLVLDLARLTGDNLNFIKEVKKTGLKSTMEMVSWSREDWPSPGDSLPPEENPETYLANILANIERTYPSQTLITRTFAPAQTARLSRLDKLQPLLVDCERLIDGRKPASIDWSAVNIAEPKALRDDLTELTNFTNTYRHLGIAELINDKEINLDQKKKAIGKRLQLVEKFNSNNPSLDLRLVNFISHEEGSLNWQGISTEDRPLVRKQMMAFQRVLSLAGDTQNQQQLLNKGFDSSRSIASLMLSRFIAESGLSENVARRIYNDARKKTDSIIHSVESIRDTISGGFSNIGMADNSGILRNKLYNDLRGIDGLEELFGSQNYCACEECRSILSPAAYFVDLMHFIEENISSAVQPKHIAFANHSLYLKRRRPDLWKLNLTCENTNTLIPYLTIVNEVLSGYLELILGTKDVFKELNNKHISFNLPFSLPMAELRLYLNHFGITLHGLCRLLEQPKEMFWQARLDLSKQEFDVIIMPDTAEVKHRYGNPVNFNNPAFDVQEFLRRTGIDRDQLDILRALGFNPDLKNIHIVKQQNPDEIQTYVEYFSGLTNPRLDFIHRFIRLWRKTGWDLKEMDLVLCALRDAKLIEDDISQGTVEYVARLVDLQQAFQLSVEELCAMFHYLPASPAFPSLPSRVSDERLMERLFDIQALFDGDNTYYHYSLDKNVASTAVPEIDPKTPFLLGGLGISETEMLLLFELLKEKMPFDDEGETALDQEKLSLLYRHVRLAKALKWSVDELVFALRLIFSLDGATIEKLKQIDQLQDFCHWQKASPFSVYELAFILSEKESNRISYQVTLQGSANLALECQKYKNLSFAKSVLADLDKIRTEDSETILTEMASDGLLIEVGDGYRIDPLNYRLTQDFDAIFTTLALPDEVTAQKAAIRAKLNEFHPFAVAYTSYANIDQQTFEYLIPFVEVDAADGPITTGLQVEFDGDGNPKNRDELKPFLILLKALERIRLLFDQLKFKVDDIRLVAENPDIFGIGDLEALDLDNLKTLVLYRDLMPRETQAKASMQAVMQDFVPDVDSLADIWQVDISLVNSLKRSLSLPAESVKAIGYLKRTLDCCRLLGVNGFSLKKLIEVENYTQQTKARDIALGAFSSRYEDEQLRREKLEPYQDRINTLKRDALCDYIIAREKELKFEDHNDLYNFFLLDAEMSGCFRTSRLVCGLSSLQLYVHRVLANLEQSTSGDVLVLQSLVQGDLPQIREEWQWRQNYRVWEANRKVFLYPENYLEPDLRDNKTPIFKELEEELLQEKITEESAEAAYKKYLTQFSELARLRIAGTYYHKEEGDGGTYYFFGRTQQDPPQYYYRTWDQKAWSAWQKIELGINADYVSAVIHHGKLFLFWIERKESEVTKVIRGSSVVIGISVETILFYSFLNEKGKWISTQRIDIGEILFDGWSVRIVNNTDGESYTEYGPPDLYEGNEVTLDESKCYLRVYLRNISESINISILSPSRGKQTTNLMSDQYWYNLDLFLNSSQQIEEIYSGEFERNFVKLNKNPTENSSFIRASEILVKGWFIEKHGNIYATDQNNKFSSEFDTKIFQPDIDAIPSKPQDYIIKLGNQQYLTQWKLSGYFDYRNTIRLTTSLVEPLGEKLLDEGLEAFLSLETQQGPGKPPGESSVGVDFLLPWIGPASVKHIDFKGSYGPYYRELFFHIPFLIAHHLNANQKFEEAKWWYERIFDPTGTETPGSTIPNERNWRYLEFRDLSTEKIKDILTDEAAIEQYEKDPFSPHAIARLRLGAYQKTIVMKYIDNLLDWGDSLFAQDTMESINEATMLYVLAADILGKKPVELGKCDTVPDDSLTYEKIRPNIGENDDFLITMENWNLAVTMERPMLAMKNHMAMAVKENSNLDYLPAYKGKPEYRMRNFMEMVEENNDFQLQPPSKVSVNPDSRPPHLSLVDSTGLVFCVPPNVDLLKYWDRVSDRLFKIRHCMNISGMRRQLALFQPPIDPMALVRAKAAGLSLDDILNMMGAQLPPYRFAYLIEKAKQYTQTVQSFGSALLSALEKKDVEELTLLRSVHERNIMKLTKEIKKQQLAEAQFQYQSVVESKINIQNRILHYQSLIDTGLTKWETTQQISTHAATLLKGAEGVLHAAAGIYYLIPNSGSPFAMTYGGEELGDSGVEFAQWTASMAAVANQIAASTSLEAANDRREQEWNQQLLLAEQELNQVEQQRLASDIRQLIAEKDLENYEKQMEQADELDAFYKNKFTNLGLYTYLSTTMHRLYRQAYNIAYDMARMAEQAYQFERDDKATFFIGGDNWQFDRAGLLAGERLLLQLQHMEKAHLEKNSRELEITQSFSLALLNPEALIEFRQKGDCIFVLPEIAYDLVYPGQYKRIIKSVRLTIPCVTGPFTNIGATLSLTSSELRREPKLPSEQNLKPVPLQQAMSSIATSSAVNDSGVFELNFRDERYLPFEGAGAVSKWGLALPTKVRQFDYNTISDVIIHVSYTALYGGDDFKLDVEKDIVDTLSNDPGLFRIFSLRHEFPDAFHQLLTAPESPQSTEIEIKQNHFPYFLGKFDLLMSEVSVFVRRKIDEPLVLQGLTIKGVELKWIPYKEEMRDMQQTEDITLPGSPIGTWSVANQLGDMKKEEIADIFMVIKYKKS